MRSHWNLMLTCHNHDKHTAHTLFYISVSWTGKAHLACRVDFCCRGNGHTGLKRDRWTFDHMTDACWLFVICPVNVCTQCLNSQLAFKVSASTFKSWWGNPLIVLLYMCFSRRGKTNTQINKPNFFVSFEFHLNSQSLWHTPIPSTHIYLKSLQRQFIYVYFFLFLLSIFEQWTLNLPFSFQLCEQTKKLGQLINTLWRSCSVASQNVQ